MNSNLEIKDDRVVYHVDLHALEKMKTGDVSLFDVLFHIHLLNINDLRFLGLLVVSVSNENSLAGRFV
jgi:hypothetical protein